MNGAEYWSHMEVMMTELGASNAAAEAGRYKDNRVAASRAPGGVDRISPFQAPVPPRPMTGDDCFDPNQLAALVSRSVRGDRDARLIHEALQKGKEGDSLSQVLVGLVLAEGKFGVARDGSCARTWLRRAANGGHPVAQYQLALLLESGVGGNVDLTEAQKWSQAAAEAGNPEAPAALKRIESSLAEAVARDIQPGRWRLECYAGGFDLNLRSDNFLEGSGRFVGVPLDCHGTWKFDSSQRLLRLHTQAQVRTEGFWTSVLGPFANLIAPGEERVMRVAGGNGKFTCVDATGVQWTITRL